MSNLATLASGSTAVISSLPGKQTLARRLLSMGITPGSEVHMLQNRGRGALIFEVHGARLALGRNSAEWVQVVNAETFAKEEFSAGRQKN